MYTFNKLKFANYYLFVVINLNLVLNQFIMNDFRQYEEAIALYHNKLSINTAPVYSWDFHNDFLCSIKNFF
jgi:hypothetical protein